ncbi:VOC family protein, partial [Escherichia coli]|uniref:VOC family protein n=1 Tax=Escherichia coli TaxID=562 RepID=UPI00142B1174|nr:glyoxalase [Escherichia coli]
MKNPVIVLFLTVSLAAAGTAFGQNTLGIIRHNHLAIQVKDVPASAVFYRDVLGLKPIPVPDNLKLTRAWFDIGNGQQVH